MKATHILVISLLVLPALFSCNKDGSSDQDGIRLADRQEIVLTKTQRQIVSKSNAFAFDFFREICTIDKDKEIFISPFSLEAGLFMLAAGAEGSTYSSISGALGLDGLSKEELNAAYRSLATALLAADNSATFALANALWLNKGFPVLPSYSGVLGQCYGASVDNLDFSTPKALDVINSWTKKSTGGMIPVLFEELNPEWVYILANALYFKGVWAEKFSEHNTYREDFHCLSGKTSSIDFMHGDIPCSYTYDEEAGAAMCELPFGNKAFLLDILLPDTGRDFGSFIGSLNAEKWNGFTENLRGSDSYVILPKFDISFTGKESFKQALVTLGMEEIFSASADFSGISETPTCLSDVIQKTRFKIDENGAEAAAVTAFTGEVTDAGPSPEFFVDRPFVYAIREFSTGVILFIGACKNLQ